MMKDIENYGSVLRKLAPIQLAGSFMSQCLHSKVPFDPPLDVGIREFVECLSNAGIETFESCQGGKGHSYPEPTVRFHGERPEGYKAVGIALGAGFQVKELKRVWPVLDGELTGPYWELTLISPAG